MNSAVGTSALNGFFSWICQDLVSSTGATITLTGGNISSTSGDVAIYAGANIGIGSNVMYCASKAALDNMTKSLARALAPKIRVVSVSPALVDTEFVKSLDQVWHDEQAARTPMGRLATPDEIGNAVRAVIDTLTFSTGCIIQVDGGRTLCS